MVKTPPAMREPQELWAVSLNQEDLLEEGVATHSSILAWITPGTEQPGGLQSVESQSVKTRLKQLSTAQSVAPRGTQF